MTERVITVGIGQVLLVSATSGFSSYIKLAAPLLRSSSSSGSEHLTSNQKVLGSIPSWAPISLLSHIPSLMICIHVCTPRQSQFCYCYKCSKPKLL